MLVIPDHLVGRESSGLSSYTLHCCVKCFAEYGVEQKKRTTLKSRGSRDHTIVLKTLFPFSAQGWAGY